jgi:hypothetical protein
LVAEEEEEDHITAVVEVQEDIVHQYQEKVLVVAHLLKVFFQYLLVHIQLILVLVELLVLVGLLLMQEVEMELLLVLDPLSHKEEVVPALVGVARVQT